MTAPTAADGRQVDLAGTRDYTLGDARRIDAVAGGHDDGELLAAEPADDVVRPDRRAQRVGQEPQQLVADAVAVHVVDALEVVDVEHQDGDGPMRSTRLLDRVQQPLVEAAVVEQAGERVGLRFPLEPRADLRVVDRERGGVAESFRELELVFGEQPLVALAVDVEHALDVRACDERNRDERFRVDRRAGHETNARVEMRTVDERGLAAACGPTGDALVETDARAQDLRRVLVAGEHRHEQPLRLVGLVDRERVVRDEVGERVGDAHEQCVEALLGEHLVEDVREPAVRLDERRRRSVTVRHEPEGRFGARHHVRARGSDLVCRRVGLLASKQASPNIAVNHAVALPRSREQRSKVGRRGAGNAGEPSVPPRSFSRPSRSPERDRRPRSLSLRSPPREVPRVPRSLRRARAGGSPRAGR